jgi:putative membrane protein
MSELKIRPSTTLIQVKYGLALLLAAVLTYFGWSMQNKYWMIGYAAPALLIITAAMQHMKTRFVTLELVGDRLKYEAGVASKTSRSIPLHKVQDVTVSQSFGQRILGMGDISIETAGESSRLVMQQIHSPRVIAEQILDRVAGLNPKSK